MEQGNSAHWGSLEAEADVSEAKVVLSDKFTPDFDVLLSNNDVIDFLRTVPDETFQLIATSPPYNIGKPYEKRKELAEYLEFQRKVLVECGRVLKKGGSLCWQVGNYVENGEVYPLDIFFYGLIREIPDFHLRNRIVWFFEHGLHASKRFSGRYETILWFSKGDEYLFNLDNVRVPQKYPGKTYYKGAKRGLPSGNPRGMNPGNIWQLKEDWDSLVWDIPNVKSNHVEKTIHPAQFPIELVERLVLALTKPKDIVFDPYAGVGSTVVASLIHGRRATGVDKEKAYIGIALDRVNQAKSGRLRYRPLGTEKHVPTGKEKVSQIPDAWKDK